MLNKNFFVIVFLIFLSLSQVFSQDKPIENKNHILFLMRSGRISQAIDVYRQYHQQLGKHDYDLIQEMGLLLLDQGFHSSDPDIRMMTTFGAGISLNERALNILEASIDSGVPELQMIGLNFLSQYHHDIADEALQRAMNSPHPLIRLETAYILAQKKAPRAYAYAESLMYRFEDLILPLFPQFFAMIGTAEATRMLRKLMGNANEDVRMAAILSAAKYGRDDLLPKIRTLATHHEKAQQEACAYALGVLKDEKSIPRLEILARSNVPQISLAAQRSLYQLGRKEYKSQIEQKAREHDVYAIGSLGDIEGSEDLLAELLKDKNLQVKVNAAVALLHLKDPRCLPVLIDILVMDSKGLIFSKISSKGRSLSAWKAVPSGKQNFNDDPVAFELSLNLREDLLEEALDLPEKDFLAIAKVIFMRQQNDLVPLLSELLEKLHSTNTIALLKEHQQQIGAPLIRNYCNLALYNLKEPGPYSDNIRAWVGNMHNEELIRFRPFLPMELRDHEETYQLTPQDNSSFLIASFESFITNKDEKGIDILLNAIDKGNNKNKYALAGLLMRATN